MIITFCGHKELYDEKEVKVWLERVTENLIVNGAETFYLGGYGAFDRLAASVLAKQKKRYPHIELLQFVRTAQKSVLTRIIFYFQTEWRSVSGATPVFN